MKIKCIITDDEPIARKGIRSYIEKIDFLELQGECEDAIQLNKLLIEQETDLIFLDIEMPHLSGMELLAQLKNPPKVIIISAYERYALKGYEFDVIDYLLKPVSFDRFMKAVNKVYESLSAKERETPEPYLFIKSNKVLKKIMINDILCVQSMENYIIIHTTDSKEITSSTLKNFMEHLPQPQFLQVHRSYVVNTDMIEALDGNQLVIGTHKIPIARNLREQVFEALLKNKLLLR